MLPGVHEHLVKLTLMILDDVDAAALRLLGDVGPPVEVWLQH
jgi:hypothetical protein